MKSNIVNKNIHKIIPGGGHTYSKGDDQFPENAPKIITNAKGVYCWDLEKNKYTGKVIDIKNF